MFGNKKNKAQDMPDPPSQIVVGSGSASGKPRFWVRVKNIFLAVQASQKYRAGLILIAVIVFAGASFVAITNLSPDDKEREIAVHSNNTKSPTTDSDSTENPDTGTPDVSNPETSQNSGTTGGGQSSGNKSGNQSSGNTGGGSGGGSGGGGGSSSLECPAFPAFPDENCTGWQHTGVTLQDCGGSTDNGYIWDSNLTFDSCYFPQSLTIYGDNITITRSQVHGTVTPHWSKSYSFGNLTLVDVEIEQTGVANILTAAIAGHNYSCLRCNVHHTLSGMHFGDNTTIRDSYTHDFQWRDGAHGTGIGAGQGHGSNSSIIHNNIQCSRVDGPPICSSALSIYPESNDQGGTVHNVTVEKNLFNATGAYCVYAGGQPATNINFLNNYFGKKFYPDCAGYGPVTSYQPEGGQWVGNVWADGSGPVNP